MTYDAAKNVKNIRIRGLSFELASEFHPEDAVITRDERHHYGEDRYVAFWILNDRLHVLCFTLRAAEEMRVISLLKANAREIKAYEKNKASH